MRCFAFLALLSLALSACGGGGGSHGAAGASAVLPSLGSGNSQPLSAIPQHYTLVDLGANVFPARINNRKAVVGNALHGGVTTAFYYLTHLQFLGIPAGDNASFATDINDSGAIVGYSTSLTVLHALEFHVGGAPQNLGVPSGEDSSAADAVNNAGVIVGESYLSTDGCFGAETVSLTIFDGHGGATAPIGRYSSSPTAINANGTVVFTSITPSTHPCVAFSTFPMLYPGLTFVPLPANDVDLHGETFAQPADINDSGSIIGNYSAFNNLGIALLTGFYVHGGVVQEIDPPIGLGNGNKVKLTGINNHERFVGGASFANGYHAFVWANGKMTDLNTYLPASSDWVLNEAENINDRGTIVGKGTVNGVEHGFMLVPSGFEASVHGPARPPLQKNHTSRADNIA